MQLANTVTVPLLRIAFGSVFFVAALAKAYAWGDFYHQLLPYRLPFSPELLYLGACALTALETWIGMAVLLRVETGLAIRTAQVLLAFMIPLTIWGSLLDIPSCGCYGSLLVRKPWVATIEDCVLLLLSFLLLQNACAKVESLSEHGDWTDRLKLALPIINALAIFIYGLASWQSVLNN